MYAPCCVWDRIAAETSAAAVVRASWHAASDAPPPLHAVQWPAASLTAVTFDSVDNTFAPTRLSLAVQACERVPAVVDKLGAPCMLHVAPRMCIIPI